MKTLAIDPGTNESAYVEYDSTQRKIISFGKEKNPVILSTIKQSQVDTILIEMVNSYGMPVGLEVFHTVVWIGRFFQQAINQGICSELIYRKDIKLHHCGSAKAKDGNIIQALKDKYGDKGTKKNKGFFFGFNADVWQAFAIIAFYIESTIFVKEK